jgi:hypothetical protein
MRDQGVQVGLVSGDSIASDEFAVLYRDHSRKGVGAIVVSECRQARPSRQAVAGTIRLAGVHPASAGYIRFDI